MAVSPSAASSSSHYASPRSSHPPPPITVSDIMKQGSVAASHAASPRPRRQASAVTVAEVMRQNSRLPPLDAATATLSGRSQQSMSPMKKALALAASSGSLTSARRQPSQAFLVATAADAAATAPESGRSGPSALTHRAVSIKIPQDGSDAGYSSKSRRGSLEYRSDNSCDDSAMTLRRRMVLPPISTRPSGVPSTAAAPTPRSANK